MKTVLIDPIRQPAVHTNEPRPSVVIQHELDPLVLPLPIFDQEDASQRTAASDMRRIRHGLAGQRMWSLQFEQEPALDAD